MSNDASSDAVLKKTWARRVWQGVWWWQVIERTQTFPTETSDQLNRWGPPELPLYETFGDWVRDHDVDALLGPPLFEEGEE